MKRRTKKTAAVVLSVILLLVLTFAVLPFVFKDKVMEIARRELNKRLTAEVNFRDLKISFIRSFPDASVSLKDLYIVGKDDFEGDTLLMSKDVNLVINLKSLFGDTGYEVKRMQINDSKVLAHVLKDGRANWDIFPEDTANVDTTESGFKFKLQDFNIARADVVYLSDSGNVAARMKNLNLNLNGDLTADSTLLSTNFTIDTLNFWNGGVHYASNLVVEFTADINAILSEDRYEFANNEMKINAIPLSLNGWVQMPDDEIEMDLTLNTEQVDFKSLLSLIPAIYTNSF
ncbi:MAG TPA: AsmA family protein, partial [Paludibacteraceae bacterium]|nr:AsmA family protein [Paludibacteraceae bacterium]